MKSCRVFSLLSSGRLLGVGDDGGGGGGRGAIVVVVISQAQLTQQEADEYH